MTTASPTQHQSIVNRSEAAAEAAVCHTRHRSLSILVGVVVAIITAALGILANRYIVMLTPSTTLSTTNAAERPIGIVTKEAMNDFFCCNNTRHVKDEKLSGPSPPRLVVTDHHANDELIKARRARFKQLALIPAMVLPGLLFTLSFALAHFEQCQKRNASLRRMATTMLLVMIVGAMLLIVLSK